MKTLTQQLCLTAMLLFSWQAQGIDVDKHASIYDTKTTMLGINHIGLSVKDLDSALAFYLQASDFELLRREKISRSKEADTLYGHENITLEIAVLRAPNMLFELIEFERNTHAPTRKKPPHGAGMTHTCFQSPSDDPGWDKFIDAGATALTRGNKPVDLGGYGVTYGYAYDPEGNMIELEQLDGDVLARAGYDQTWQDTGEDLWMSQVALVTHDIESLMTFYQKVLGFTPYRETHLTDNVKAGLIADIDDLNLKGGWFRMNDTSKVIEIWQFVNPVTHPFKGERDATTLGYSFSLEVGDIQQEYQRLNNMGVDFISAPIKSGEFWQAYARDLDGNVFSLRQAVDAKSKLSVRVMDSSTNAEKKL